MMRNISFIASAAFLAGASSIYLPASADTIFSADFNAGTFPKGVTVENATGVLPDPLGYKRGYTKEGWIIDRFGSKGYVALSPTYTHAEGEIRNVMTLPRLSLTEGTLLSWNVCSVYGQFPDSYRVELYFPASDRRVTLCEEGSVSERWESRAYMLEPSYGESGEEVEISFICNSKGGYMLALDDIYVGLPTEPVLQTVSLPDIFHGADELVTQDGRVVLPVDCTVRNLGLTATSVSVVWEVDGVEYPCLDIDEALMTGKDYSFGSYIPVEIDKPVKYEIFAVGGGRRIQLASDVVFVSEYKRHMVVDEATGMWCTNCPEGKVELDAMEYKLGGSLIPLVTHQGDPLETSGYWNSLGFYALPYFRINRIGASAADNTSGFSKYFYQPTPLGVEITGMKFIAADQLEVEVLARGDAGSDSYGIGYVVTGDFGPDLDYYQKNGATRVNAGPYYYLPTMIPGDLVKFNDVTLTSDHAFAPFEESMFTGRGEFPFSFKINRPELLSDWNAGRLVVMLLKKGSLEVMNAAEMNISTRQPDVSLTSVGSDPVSPVALVQRPSGDVEIRSGIAGILCVDILSPEGVVVARSQSRVSEGDTYVLPLSGLKGLHIVRANVGEYGVCRKIYNY